MKDFSVGRSHNGRRTRIVDEKEPMVLVTRTLWVQQLVPLSSYNQEGKPPATEQVAREYEADLPMEDQVQAIVEATQFVPEEQMNVSVRVAEVHPNFDITAHNQSARDRKARGQYQHGQGN